MANEIEPRPTGPEERRDGPGSFLRFPALQDVGPNGGVEIVLSGDAYRLHLYAMMDSLATPSPGVVTDGYLAAQREDPSAAVASLCAAGLWERCDDGFRVVDPEALEAMENTASWASQVAEDCVTGAGHLPDATDPSLCAVCHGPIPALGSGVAPDARAGAPKLDPGPER